MTKLIDPAAKLAGRVVDTAIKELQARDHDLCPNAEVVLDVSQRERKSDVQHHRQADDLGAAVEALERVGSVIAGR